MWIAIRKVDRRVCGMATTKSGLVDMIQSPPRKRTLGEYDLMEIHDDDFERWQVGTDKVRQCMHPVEDWAGSLCMRREGHTGGCE